MEDREKPPVKILDKRHFDKDGARREADGPEGGAEEELRPSSASPPDQPASRASEKDETMPDGASPFTNFVLSLSSSCFMSLGQIPNPMTGSAEMDLPSAGSIIDILEMLKSKTQGNLDAYEQNLLDRTLSQLKLIYVQATHKNEP